MQINEILFTFYSNPYSFFPFVTAIVYVFLVYKILAQETIAPIHRWLIGLFVAGFLAGISEMFASMSVYPDGAAFWWSAENTMQIFITTFILGWTLHQIGLHKLIEGGRAGILFIPPIVIGFITWVTDYNISHNVHLFTHEFGAWRGQLGDYYVMNNSWMYLGVSLAALLLLLYRIRSVDKLRKKQAELFIIGFVITMFLFAAGPAIQRAVFGEVLVPVGGIYSMPLMILIAYGVVKYKLFYMNPTMVIENMISSISEVLLVVNPEYELEFAGGRVDSLLDLNSEDLVGKKLKEIITGGWEQFKKEVVGPIGRGDQVAVTELELNNKQNEPVPVKISASPYIDTFGKMHGVVMLVTDLRELHELLYLAAERNKLEVITSSITDGIIGLDLNKNITMVNPAALEMFGLRKEEVVGASIDSFITITKDDATYNTDDLLADYVEVQDRVVASWFDVVVTTKGQGPIPANVVSSVIKEGRLVGLGAIVSIHNLSEERELERMKLDFVSMAAHELRTPLTSIRGYLDALKQELEGKTTEDEQMLMSRIDISALQLTGLMENLLSVTKIEKGTYQLNREKVDWVKLVRAQVESLKVQANHQGLELKLVCKRKRIPKVVVDPLRIVEVINNLVSNAIRYTNEGSVTVQIDYDKEKKSVSTSVTDTGQGIPKEAMPKIFEKFFRVSGVLEQGSKGTGLGLYIAKAIVNLHGGEIWVTSEGTGRGSTFGFSLPINETVKD